MGSRSTDQTVYSAGDHIIWSPTSRRCVLATPLEARLKELVAQGVAEAAREAVEVEVLGDHVHLVEVPPPLRRLPAPWSSSWSISTVGGALLEVLRRDVGNEKRAA